MRIHRWLWVAWNEDDYGRRHHVRMALTQERATTRTLRAVHVGNGRA